MTLYEAIALLLTFVAMLGGGVAFHWKMSTYIIARIDEMHKSLIARIVAHENKVDRKFDDIAAVTAALNENRAATDQLNRTITAELSRIREDLDALDERVRAMELKRRN